MIKDYSQFLLEQQLIDIGQYLGDTFDIQDSTAEDTSGRNKHLWGDGQVFRERVENAGDILRELSSRGNQPDVRYIEEKIIKLEAWLKSNFENIPEDINTLEDFNKTYLKYSSALDTRDYIVKFHPEVLNKIILEYENIPVYCKETKLAKDLCLNLLNGNNEELLKNLNQVKAICVEIKKNGFITFNKI